MATIVVRSLSKDGETYLSASDVEALLLSLADDLGGVAGQRLGMLARVVGGESGNDGGGEGQGD